MTGKTFAVFEQYWSVSSVPVITSGANVTRFVLLS